MEPIEQDLEVYTKIVVVIKECEQVWIQVQTQIQTEALHYTSIPDVYTRAVVLLGAE